MPPKKPAAEKKTPVSSPNPAKPKKAQDNTKSKFTPVKCKVCTKECLDPAFFNSDDDDSINCDVCNLWYHKTCTNTSSSEWETLKGRNENITFRCDDCLNLKAQNNNQIQIFQQLLRENNDILLKRLEGLETKILQKVDDKIDMKMQEYEVKNDKIIEDKIKAQLESEKKNKSDQDIHDSIKVQVKQAIEDLREREERKCNLILFNLKESTKTELTEEVS